MKRNKKKKTNNSNAKEIISLEEDEEEPKNIIMSGGDVLVAKCNNLTFSKIIYEKNTPKLQKQKKIDIEKIKPVIAKIEENHLMIEKIDKSAIDNLTKVLESEKEKDKKIIYEKELLNKLKKLLYLEEEETERLTEENEIISLDEDQHKTGRKDNYQIQK